MHLTHLQP